MAPFASRAPVTLPSFSCQTTCFALFILALEVGTTPALFVLQGLSTVYRGTYLTCAIISVISVLGGILGVCRATPAAIISLVISIAVTFAFTIFGGLCVIFTFDVRSAVASYLNKSLTPVGQEYNKKLLFETKVYLIAAASILLSSAFFHLLYVRHLYSVVGERRGAIAFLQIFSLIAFPFSLFLVVGGQYIVDTGTLASAPYTGIIVFVCGVLLLAIASLAFIGGSFEYRRLLSVCVLLSFGAGTAFVGLSIAYFALRGQIQEHILQHWESLRVILPPTFQARYDRDQFIELIQTNLQAVAYVGIVCGLFVFQEANVCMTLMHHATLLKRQMAHDRQTMRHIETESKDSEASVVKPSDPHVLQRHQWSQHFESSKRRQRVAMRLLVFVFILAVALVFGVMCANVVFATKCHSIGKLVQSTNFSLFQDINASSVEFVHIENRFTRGSVRLVAANDGAGDVMLEQYGNAERSKKDETSFERRQDGSTLAVTIRPIDVTRFLWIDGSCQRSVMNVQLPSDELRRVSVSSNASVEIRGASAPSPLALRALTILTDQANINGSDVAVAEGGLSLVSNSGEIDVSDSSVFAKGHKGVDTKAHIYSALGAVTITNASFVDCDVSVATGAGTLELTTITGIASIGRSRISAKSVSGAIYASFVQANWVDLSSEDGDIFGVGVRTEGNNAFSGRMQVTNIAGHVTLQQVDPRGSVLIETSSGNIKLQLKTLGFAGLYYARSDYGNVTVRKGRYANDVLTELPDTSNGQEKRGTINCDPSTGSCLSYGDLHLRSRLGDVEILLGCDTFQCD